MNLKSIYQISGVKVVSGKGKGTSTAYPGDIYEIDEDRGTRHIDDGIATAVESDTKPAKSGKGSKKAAAADDAPDISGVADPIKGDDDLGLSDVE